MRLRADLAASGFEAAAYASMRLHVLKRMRSSKSSPDSRDDTIRIRDAPEEGFPDIERTRTVVRPNEDQVPRLGFVWGGTCRTRRHPIWAVEPASLFERALSGLSSIR